MADDQPYSIDSSNEQYNVAKNGDQVHRDSASVQRAMTVQHRDADMMPCPVFQEHGTQSMFAATTSPVDDHYSHPDGIAQQHDVLENVVDGLDMPNHFFPSNISNDGFKNDYDDLGFRLTIANLNASNDMMRPRIPLARPPVAQPNGYHQQDPNSPFTQQSSVPMSSYHHQHGNPAGSHQQYALPTIQQQAITPAFPYHNMQNPLPAFLPAFQDQNYNPARVYQQKTLQTLQKQYFAQYPEAMYQADLWSHQQKFLQPGQQQLAMPELIYQPHNAMSIDQQPSGQLPAMQQDGAAPNPAQPVDDQKGGMGANGRLRAYKKRTVPSDKAGKTRAPPYSKDETRVLKYLMEDQPKPGSGKAPNWGYVAEQLQLQCPIREGHRARTADGVQGKWWRLNGGDPKRAEKIRQQLAGPGAR